MKSSSPVSSALTLHRRHEASTETMSSAEKAMEIMLSRGLQSGASFKATVAVSGANVSATFSITNAGRPGPRPQTARLAETASTAHAVQIQSSGPPVTARPASAAPGARSPPCKFFAAGFCKYGQSCTYSHIVQQAQCARQATLAPVSPGAASFPAMENPVPKPSHARQQLLRPSSASSPSTAKAGGGAVQKVTNPVYRQAAKPPQAMQCLICMDNGWSNEGVVCRKGGHFMHRACLDTLITHNCNEYLTHGPSKPSSVACPHDGNKCCVFTYNQLRREGGVASASCIALLDRVEQMEAAIKKLPLQEQLRRANQDAYMCPQCNFGPVAHYACPDLSWQGNRCPRCSYHTENISGWRKWDGNFAVAV
jgi:hypothetical protein